MGVLERGLAKLTLEAHQTHDPERQALGKFSAMYNPESVNLDYAADYTSVNGLAQNHDVSCYRQVQAPTLSLTLVLDARGPQGGKPVEDQLSALRALCFKVGNTGEPPYLKVTWGCMSWHGQGHFLGRPLNLSIAYTLFDRNARPLRATATLTLIAQTSDVMAQIRAPGKSLEQVLMLMQDKTSLPQLLAQSTLVAGSGSYLKVAYANNADHLSGWAPGQMLITG